ncbi:MAG TPA: hypothetical protein VGD67_17360 [Pseudonocardiaceae bacterium]
MAHATLAFLRVRFRAVRVPGEDGPRYLEESPARQYFEATAPEWAEYVARVEARRVRRRELRESAVVQRDVQVRRDTGGLLRSKVRVDFVTFGRDRHEVEAGAADAFVREYVDRRYPDLAHTLPDPFHDWFRANGEEFRSWRAVLITAGGTVDVDLGLDPTERTPPVGFPAEYAMRELDRLASEGWTLLQVCEELARDPAGDPHVTRVRYVLTRTDGRPPATGDH